MEWGRQSDLGGKAMKKGFTLIELLIVVCILGIMAAIVIPTYRSYSNQVKESTAKDDLQTLRTIIELYTTKHNGAAPGYPSNDTDQAPTEATFLAQLASGSGSSYTVVKFPENPFNGMATVKVLANGDSFPSDPVETDTFGWIYQPGTRNFRLNWSGTDSAGARYFDY